MGLITYQGQVCALRQTYQIEPGETQDACGPYTGAELAMAGLPGQQPRGSAEQIDVLADHWYTTYIGPNVASDTAGSTIDNMHTFFVQAVDFFATKDGHRLLHWFDIGAISPQSRQADDLARIRRALAAGYPLAVTVNEQSVKSKKLGKCPYPWQPALGPVTHVFTIIGVDSAGDFIVGDELNNQEAWPQVYYAANIEVHWASIIQLVGDNPANPWLLPIPSGDPLDSAWKAGWIAQNFREGQPPAPVVSNLPQLKQFQAVWNSTPLIFGGMPPSYTAPIAREWTAHYRPKFGLGPPITPEYPCNDWQGAPRTFQNGADWECQYEERVGGRWWQGGREITLASA